MLEIITHYYTDESLKKYEKTVTWKLFGIVINERITPLTKNLKKKILN
jgi:hypothetical protein